MSCETDANTSTANDMLIAASSSAVLSATGRTPGLPSNAATRCAFNYTSPANLKCSPRLNREVLTVRHDNTFTTLRSASGVKRWYRKELTVACHLTAEVPGGSLPSVAIPGVSPGVHLLRTPLESHAPVVALTATVHTDSDYYSTSNAASPLMSTVISVSSVPVLSGMNERNRSGCVATRVTASGVPHSPSLTTRKGGTGDGDTKSVPTSGPTMGRSGRL